MILDVHYLESQGHLGHLQWNINLILVCVCVCGGGGEGVVSLSFIYRSTMCSANVSKHF